MLTGPFAVMLMLKRRKSDFLFTSSATGPKSPQEYHFQVYMAIQNHPIKPSVIMILLEKAKSHTSGVFSPVVPHANVGSPARYHCMAYWQGDSVVPNRLSPGQSLPSATLCPVTGPRAPRWTMPAHQQWPPSSRRHWGPPIAGAAGAGSLG